MLEQSSAPGDVFLIRERPRLLRQRVEEHAARIEALEAALERPSADQSAVSSQEELSVRDDPDEAMSIRRRVQEWLTGGS